MSDLVLGIIIGGIGTVVAEFLLVIVARKRMRQEEKVHYGPAQ